MTTRNLVPRADSQGKIGISGTRWEEVNAVTIKATSLQNSNGSSLLVNDAGIKDIATVNNQLVIALDGTFLTDRLGFNADSTKPDFTLPNGDALPNNTIIAAGDSLVAAVQKLNDSLRDVAAPTNLTVGSFTAATIVLEGDGISNNDNDTTLPTSAAVKDYVDSQITLEDLDLAGDSGTGAVDLNSQSLTIAGGTGLTSAASAQTITLNIDNTEVTAGSYGSSTAIPTFTVDAQGRLTAAGSEAISTKFTLSADSGADDEFLVGGTLTFAGTQDVVSTTVSNDTITIDLVDTDVTAGTYGDANSVAQFTVDAQGRLTQAANFDISITSSQVSDATKDNTADMIVKRDGSGNFAAGTITATLAGNASSASEWDQAITLTLGTDLSGSVDIKGDGNVTLDATIAPNSVALGTDTTGNYVGTIIAGNGLSSTGAETGEGIAHTISVDGVLAQLDNDLAELADGDDDGKFIVATGDNTFTYEKGDTAKTSLGLGTGDSPEFSGLTLDNQASLTLKELNENGNNAITLSVPASLSKDYTITLPPAVVDGNDDLDIDGKILVSDATGALTWSTVNAEVDAVESFSTISVAGQNNILAAASEATLTFAAGSGIALTTNSGANTLTIETSSIDNNDIAAAAAIADTKLATISTADKVSLSAINIDGAVQIDALADADLIIVDDGAGGSNKKSAMSQVATYINNHASINTLSELSSVGKVGQTLTAAGHLTVSGNLIVNGDSTTVTTSTLTVQDSLISLAKDNNSTDTLDIGFYGLYDASGDNSQDSYAGLFRDADDSGKFKLFKDLQVAPTATVNTAGAGYAKATLVADIEGNVTGTVSSLGNHDTDDLTEGANLYFTDTRARAAVSVTDAGGDGSLAYDNGTGVITYTGPDAAETRAHFSAGSGIGISNGEISLDISAIAEVQVAANDKFLMLDSDGSTEQLESINDIATFMAGSGLSATDGVLAVSAGTGLEINGDSIRIATGAAGTGLTGGGGNALALDLNELTAAAALDVAADSIAIIDAAQGGDANLTRKQTISGLITSVAGAGLSATGGVLALDISEISDAAVAAGDKFLMLDSDGATEQLESVDDIATFMAGTGLSASSGSLSLDLNELASATIDVAADSIAIIDAVQGENTNLTRKQTIASLISATAGDGLSATNGVLAISAGSGLDINGDSIRIATSAAGTGLSGGGGDALELNLNELSPATIDVTADSIAIIDADDSNSSKKESIADVMSAVAGTGLAASSGSLSLDLNELTAAAALDMNADSIAIIDAAQGGDTNLTRKQTISGLMTAAAGAGLSAANGVLAVSAGTGLEVSGDAVRIAAAAAGTGLSGGGDNALALDLNELAAGDVAVATDSIVIIDSDDAGSKKESIADFISAVAGTGLAAAAGSLSLDVNELDEAAVAVASDSIVILDADDDSTKRESIADFITGITSTGLSASNGQVSLNYDDSTIGINGGNSKVEVKDDGITLAKLAHFTEASIVVVGAQANSTVPAEITVLDEDTLESDSATSLVTQQSVKAYVDGKLGRHGGIFLTDSADNNHANDDYNRDVIFDSSPLIRSHFGPFAYDLQALRDSAFGGDEGSDIIFYGSKSFQSSDRHFEVKLNTTAGELTTNMYDTEFTGANENTP